MKHNIFHYLAASLLLVMASGCGSDDGSKPSQPSPGRMIRVSTSISSPTRTVIEGGIQKFAPGDEFSLYVWNNADLSDLGEGVMQSYDSRQKMDAAGEWTSANPATWKDETSPHYMLGVYPARRITDFAADTYTLQGIGGGSNDGAGLIEANDLLVAVDRTGRTYSPEKVGLNFWHVMSRLDVHITFSSEWGSKPSTTDILAKACGSCTIDYLGGTAPSVTASGAQQNIHIAPAAVTREGFDASFSGIMIPQEGFSAIGIPADGRMFTFKSTEDMKLLGGNITTVNLVVRTDRVELSGIDIEPWADGGSYESSWEEVTPLIDAVNHKITTRVPGYITRAMIDEARAGTDELTVAGPIDGTDIREIRLAAGCTLGLNGSHNPIIKRLNLRDAQIKKGGIAYLSDPYVGDKYVLNDNEIPELMFYVSSLSEIVLPDGITKIGHSSFEGSGILSSLTIPASVKVIVGSVTKDCKELKSFIFEENSQCEEIGRLMLSGASKVSHIKLPQSLLRLDDTFHSCYLENITIPCNVTSMTGEYLFTTSSQLNTMVIETTPSKLTSNLNVMRTVNNPESTSLVLHDEWFSESSREKPVGNTWAGVQWKSITMLSQYSEPVNK